MALSLSKSSQRAVLIAIGVLCVMALVVVYYVRSTPAFWQETQTFLQETPQSKLQSLADGVERRIASLTWVEDEAAAAVEQPAERQTLTLTMQEANAWLDQNLPQWAAYHGYELSPEVTQPVFAVRGGRLVFAFKYQTPEVSQIISLWFRVAIEGGQARIELAQIRGGDLPMPRRALLRQFGINAEDPNMHPVFASALSGEPFDPVWQLDETREARVVGMRLSPRQVELVIDKRALP